MSDLYDDERSPIEGVRILGAEEARASLGANQPVDDDEAADEPTTRRCSSTSPTRTSSSTSASTSPTRTSRSSRVARRAQRGRPSAPTTSSPAAKPRPERRRRRARRRRRPPCPPATAPTGEVPKLPHWTEPPTGAVPAIFADDNEDDELDAWASVDRRAAPLPGRGLRLGRRPTSPTTSPRSRCGSARSATRRRSTRKSSSPATSPRSAVPRRAPRTATRGRARCAPSPTTATQAPSAPRDLPTAIMTAAAVAVVAIICFTPGRGPPSRSPRVIVGFATLELGELAAQARAAAGDARSR